MPEDKYPDFSFLNEGGSSRDSAILEAEQSQQESASAAEPPATEQASSAEQAEPEQKSAAESQPDSDSSEPAAESLATSPIEQAATANEPTPSQSSPAGNINREADGSTKKKRYESYAGQPAWMDQSQEDSPQDSSTRFASVFGEGSVPPAEAPTPAVEAPKSDQAAAPQTEPAAGASNETSPAATPASESAAPAESDATPPSAEAPPAVAAESTGVTEPAAPASEQTSPPEDVVSGNEETQLYTPSLDSPQAAIPPATTESSAPAAPPIAAASPPPSAQTSSRSRSSSRKEKQAQGPQKNLVFMLLASYASAVTLVCLYLLMQSLAGQPHHLESLPDLKPPMKNDEIAYQLAPEEAALPPGHTLKLGESRRFGNVLVTPLRIEKRPLRFTHFSGNPQQNRAETEPVLKLWVRFENVSRDQKFAPLDRELLLKRVVDPSRPEFVRSNQFLVPASRKGDLSKTRLLYDLEMFSDWNFAGFEEDPVLAPGESVELYLPSAEVRAEQIPLDQPLLWRVQFRKGYHPESYRGVTTLIEIKIDSSAIQA